MNIERQKNQKFFNESVSDKVETTALHTAESLESSANKQEDPFQGHLYLTPYVAEEADVLNLKKEDEQYTLAEGALVEFERKFKEAIIDGLQKLDGRSDNQILHIGLDGEDGDITVGDLKRHIVNMKDEKNPFGHGNPFKFGVWSNAGSPQDLREIDEAHFAELTEELIEKLKGYPPESTLYYATLNEGWDALNFDEIKEIRVDAAIEALEKNEADFWTGSSFKFISAEPGFDLKKYLEKLAKARKIKVELLDLLSDLDEEDKVYAQFLGQEPILMNAGPLRWRIENADENEILPNISLPVMLKNKTENGT